MTDDMIRPRPRAANAIEARHENKSLTPDEGNEKVMEE